MQRFLGKSPLERGAFSIAEMEKAGCVKMRTAGNSILELIIIKN
jgi:hypothetical protein